MSDYFNLATALQENILLFLADLSVRESLLLDQLVQKDCITEDELENIRSFGNRHDEIRTLIRTIKKRDTKTIFRFLEIVGEESPHLRNKVHEKFNDRQNQKINEKQQLCPTCLMTKIVDLKDIADVLWKENLLSDHLYDIVIEDADKLREILWNTILHCINKKNNSEQNIQVLIKALETKYGHIANLLQGLKSNEENLAQLQCNCYRSARKRKRLNYATSSGTSTGSLNQTSVQNIPRFGLLDQSSLEESAEDTEPKLEKLKESFDFSDPSKYDENAEEQQSVPKVVLHLSEDAFDTTMKAVSDRKRNKSGGFSSPNAVVDGDPKSFNRTVSTVVCEADSTTAGDEIDTVQIHHNTSGANQSGETKCSNKSKRDLKAVLDTMNKRGPGTEANIEGAGVDDGDEEMLEDLSASRDAKQRLLMQQFYQRQKSAPAGLTITESKPVSNLGANIRKEEFGSRKSKRSLKRQERRDRNANPLKSTLIATENAQGKIPYNPMWSKVPQRRNTCKWGYPEAKRHHLMVTKLSEIEKRGEQSKSDTEARVFDTDTPDSSEYTV